MTYFNRQKINYVVIGFIVLFGSLIAIERGSNFSDSDAPSVILTFLDFIDTGTYNASRNAYGHPIPEFLIGFFAYIFGTPYSNLFCFNCFLLSNIFFYKTFINKNDNLHLYLLVVCSNFYLLFENTNSIDYPLALLFFSCGLFLLKRNHTYYAAIIFSLCIGSRANFCLFIYPIIIIYFYQDILKGKFKRFINTLIILTLIGLIFYFPVFQSNNYTLEFLDIPFITESNQREGWYGGPALELNSLLPRFIYKIYKLIGIFSIFIFLINYKKFLNFFLSLEKDNLIICITILINLLTYFFMPTKFLIINPMMIFLYFFSFKILKKNMIYFLIFLNLFQWIISYEVIDIKYKYKSICDPVQAIEAKVNFSINEGKIIDYFSNKKEYKKCYVDFFREYSENFEKGLPLINYNK